MKKWFLTKMTEISPIAPPLKEEVEVDWSVEPEACIQRL